MTIYLIIFILLTLPLVFMSIRIVRESDALVVEFLGKYSRIMRAGFNLKIPFLERVADMVSLRQKNFIMYKDYPSVDKVIIGIETSLIFMVDASDEGIIKYTYSLEDCRQSMSLIVGYALRSYIAKETYEGILAKKDQLAVNIKNDLEKQFFEWGMFIKSFEITHASFPSRIDDSLVLDLHYSKR